MFLGIDLGTTGLKCIMYGDDLTEVASYNREYPLILKDGYVEQDAELWYSSIVAAVRGLVEKTGRRDVKALSVSTQSISFVAVDRAGAPLCNSINWLDMRAVAECEEIGRVIGEEAIYSKTGKPLDAAYSLSKILWFKRHCPDIYRDCYKILFPLDFLNMRLCGRPVTDLTVAGGSMMFNIHTCRFDGEILSAFDIDENKLPEVGVMGDFVGEVLPEVADAMGILPGCRVILGGQDQKLAAIGAGICDGVVTMSFGTAGAISKLHRDFQNYRHTPQFRFNRGHYVSEAVVETVGAALKWLSAMMGGVSYREMDELAAESQPGANGVVCRADLARGGAFSGLTLSTTRGDVIYALYEGVCREVKEKLELLGGCDTLCVFGGGSKSDIWCDILARVTGCRVIRAATPETACLGAAKIASGN